MAEPEIRLISPNMLLRNFALEFDVSDYGKVTEEDMHELMGDSWRIPEGAKPRLAGILVTASADGPKTEMKHLSVEAGQKTAAAIALFAAALAALAKQTSRTASAENLADMLEKSAPAPESGSFTGYPGYNAALERMHSVAMKKGSSNPLSMAVPLWRDAVLNGTRVLLLKESDGPAAMKLAAQSNDMLARALSDSYGNDVPDKEKAKHKKEGRKNKAKTKNNLKKTKARKADKDNKSKDKKRSVKNKKKN